METINGMSVPEVSHHEQRERVVAYAFRAPGEALWSGFASGHGRQVTTRPVYRSPADAVDAARYQLERTGNPIEEVLFPRRKGTR